MLQRRYAHLHRETNLWEAVNFTTANLSLRQRHKTVTVIWQAAGCICWWAPLPYMIGSHHPSVSIVRQFRNYRHHNTHTHNRFTALFPGPPGWAGARRELLWTLRCKGRLTEADTPTIRLGAIPSGLTRDYLHHPRSFSYRLDALPAAQPTVSKHSTEGN